MIERKICSKEIILTTTLLSYCIRSYMIVLLFKRISLLIVREKISPLCRSSTNPEKPQPTTVATTCTTVTHVTQVTSSVSIDPKIIYEDQFTDLMGKFAQIISVLSLCKEIYLS